MLTANISPLSSLYFFTQIHPVQNSTVLGIPEHLYADIAWYFYQMNSTVLFQSGDSCTSHQPEIPTIKWIHRTSGPDRKNNFGKSKYSYKQLEHLFCLRAFTWINSVDRTLQVCSIKFNSIFCQSHLNTVGKEPMNLIFTFLFLCVVIYVETPVHRVARGPIMLLRQPCLLTTINYDGFSVIVFEE